MIRECPECGTPYKVGNYEYLECKECGTILMNRMMENKVRPWE